MAETGDGHASAGVPVWRLKVARHLRALVPPLALALPPLYWVAEATHRASLTPLGRDQGIFQYVAWALTQGERDYVDVRDVNGPLTHLVHWLFLKLGGADEHRFRVLDLAVTAVAFALTGFFLPRSLGSPKARRGPPAPAPLGERIGWALAAWVVLSSQYLAFVYWDLAQRESFFDWFLLVSVSLLFAGLEAAPGRRRSVLLVASGALSIATWFGKPTFALFTALQVVALLVDEQRERPGMWARVRFFGLGGGIAAVLFGLALARMGDPAAYLRIQFVDVPAMYRFIWWRASWDVFSVPWYASQAIFALVGAIVLLGLVWLRELPRRALVVAMLPLAAIANVVAQGKGFPYHFHPVTAGIHLQWLAFALWAWERFRGPRATGVVRLVPFIVSALVSLRVATDMEDSPHIKAVWIYARGGTPARRETSEYFASFPEPDFFPYELRQTARYLRERTEPTDRVQVYGMDPYVLFLAGRLSATPYIYAYDLNCDAALAGWTGGQPDEAQSQRIREICDAHVADFRARLTRSPPAALVFLDKSPLITSNDAFADLAAHAPGIDAWVRANYRETASFGTQHVWLRRDRDPGPSPAPADEP